MTIKTRGFQTSLSVIVQIKIGKVLIILISMECFYPSVRYVGDFYIKRVFLLFLDGSDKGLGDQGSYLGGQDAKRPSWAPPGRS